MKPFKTPTLNRSLAAAAAIVLLGVSTVFVGCGNPRRGQAVTGPVDFSDPKLAEGRRVFMANCHECHPNGSGGLAPALNDRPLPQGLIKTQVRAGLGAMPAFDKNHLSDDEVDAVAAYVSALRKSAQ